MLVFKIIVGAPRNFSPTLPSDTPSCFSNPISPSKIGAGPVMPSRASSAEKTPWRPAFAKATPFQCENSPARRCRIAAPATPAIFTGVSCFYRVEFHQMRTRQRGRERAVGHVIPAARANARRVAQATLHFVSKRDGCNQFASTGADALRNGDCSRNIVAGVRRLFREIGVVKIEIANAAAVGECRPVRRPLVVGAKDCRAVLR